MKKILTSLMLPFNDKESYDFYRLYEKGVFKGRGSIAWFSKKGKNY